MNIEILLLDSFFSAFSGDCFWPFLLATLGAFILGWLLDWLLSTKWRNKAAELENELNKLQAKYSDLEKDHVSLKYQFDELQKDNTALRASLNKCESDKIVLLTKLEKLSSGDTGDTGDSGSYGTGTVDGDSYSAALKQDELQIIEGVGPKIESLLKAAGFKTWSDVANAKVEDLQKVLDDAGPRYRVHNPQDWMKQADLACKGKWAELIAFQKAGDEGKETASKVEKILAKRLGFSTNPEDLKIVEGIGPKIEGLLKAAGINTWSELAAASLDKLKKILSDAGDRYRLADPSTWPKQADLACKGQWKQLTAYQDDLKGGRDTKK